MVRAVDIGVDTALLWVCYSTQEVTLLAKLKIPNCCLSALTFIYIVLFAQLVL
jgi:hypothetical protein